MVSRWFPQKAKRLFLPLFAMLVLVPSIVAALATVTRESLDRAHEARKKGEFEKARSQFFSIVKNKDATADLREEAGYWVGYCSVIQQTYVRAVADFKWFLKNFPNEEGQYHADALYVLGKTYEMIGDLQSAATSYKLCLGLKSVKDPKIQAKAQGALNQVSDFLHIEATQKRMDPAYESIPQGHGGPVDPYSKKPFPADQQARLKKFAEAMNRGKSFEVSLGLLSQEDRELEIVKKLCAQYDLDKKKSGGKEKIPGKGEKKPEKRKQKPLK